MNPGIYKIQNTINGKFYIGSSLYIEKRFNLHRLLLNKNKHHSIILQRAWNKYKEHNFKFTIIKKCNKDNILKIEQYYINKLKPYYNVSKSAHSPMLGRKHSEKTKLKMKRRSFIGGKNHHLYGTKWTKKLRKKILKSRVGYKHSEETKLKMSKTAKRIGSSKRLNSYRKFQMKKVKDSKGNIFKSMVESAKYWNISVQTVCDILKGRHSKTRKGISFKYA